MKRSRGRPLGAKNKPKNDAISPTPTTKNVALQVPHGIDIIQWVTAFAQQNGVSLTILSGSGSISEVYLKHIGSQLPPRVITGELNLVSFSGACLVSSSVGESSAVNFFNASLVQRNGIMVGGSALRMLSVSPVVLHVLTFSDPCVCKINTLA